MQKGKMNWHAIALLAAIISFWVWIVMIFVKFKIVFINLCVVLLILMFQRINKRALEKNRRLNRTSYVVKFYSVSVILSTVFQMFFKISFMNAIVFSIVLQVFSTIVNEICYEFKD